MEGQKTINVVNGIDMDVLQDTVNQLKGDPELGKCRFHVTNKWMGGNHNCTAIESFYAAKEQRQHQHAHHLHADEPPLLAGKDEAPNPVEHLLNALASCVTTSLVAHAAVRGIHIEECESQIEGDIDLNGFLGLDNNVPKGYTDIRMKFKVKTNKENLPKLKKLAQFSPVYNTITNSAKIHIEIDPK